MSDFYNYLNAEEKQFFDHYKFNDPYLSKNEFASTLNAMLRLDRIDPEWQHALDILDQIINKNKIEAEQTFCRVTSLKNFNEFRKENILTYPAYLSTGRDCESVQYHYNSVETWETPALLKIVCPTGTCLAPFENEFTSGFEKEMLLGRNHDFEILNEEIETDGQKMGEIMGRDIAINFNKLHIIEIRLL